MGGEGFPFPSPWATGELAACLQASWCLAQACTSHVAPDIITVEGKHPDLSLGTIVFSISMIFTRVCFLTCSAHHFQGYCFGSESSLQSHVTNTDCTELLLHKYFFLTFLMCCKPEMQIVILKKQNKKIRSAVLFIQLFICLLQPVTDSQTHSCSNRMLR